MVDDDKATFFDQSGVFGLGTVGIPGRVRQDGVLHYRLGSVQDDISHSKTLEQACEGMSEQRKVTIGLSSAGARLDHPQARGLQARRLQCAERAFPAHRDRRRGRRCRLTLRASLFHDRRCGQLLICVSLQKEDDWYQLQVSGETLTHVAIHIVLAQSDLASRTRGGILSCNLRGNKRIEKLW